MIHVCSEAPDCCKSIQNMDQLLVVWMNECFSLRHWTQLTPSACATPQSGAWARLGSPSSGGEQIPRTLVPRGSAARSPGKRNWKLCLGETKSIFPGIKMSMDNKIQIWNAKRFQWKHDSYLILGDSVPVQKSKLQLQVCQPIVCSREVKHKWLVENWIKSSLLDVGFLLGYSLVFV